MGQRKAFKAASPNPLHSLPWNQSQTSTHSRHPGPRTGAPLWGREHVLPDRLCPASASNGVCTWSLLSDASLLGSLIQPTSTSCPLYVPGLF